MRSNTLFRRTPGIWCRLVMMWLAGLLSTMATSPHISQAQAPPITPSGLNTQVSAPITVPGGTQFNITGGTRPGNGPNLFHSFGEFGVPTSNIANFLNQSGLATSNILSRVTGGNSSSIFGTIQTTGFGNANLFLMNPAGFLFGPTATVNVGGMATFTTADYLRLADGKLFHATPTPAADALLSVAPVAAFGFLGSNPAAITVQGSQLAVQPAQGISLVGGNITVQNGTLDSGVVQAARLSAPGGQINVVSRVGSGEQSLVGAAGLAGPSLDPATTPRQGGTIQLTSGAMLQTSSRTGNAGRILIRGGQLVMENATLEANTSFKTADSVPSSTTPGDISIQAESVRLSQGSTISASTSGDGKAGNITFEVGTLRSNMGDDGLPLNGAAPVTIASNSTGHGGAGTISIAGPPGKVAETVALSNTKIVASVTDAAIPTIAPASTGEHVEALIPAFIPTFPPASIEITGEHVTLANGTIIEANTIGAADAGSIKFNVGTMRSQAGPDGRVLISSTSNCGVGCAGGQAGDITIQGIPGVTPTVTQRYVWIVKAMERQPTEVFNYNLAESIDLQGTDIRSDALGNAPGGMVIMRAQDQASFTNTNISVTTQDFDINNNKPNGEFARNAGFSRIDIMAQDIAMKDSTIAADGKVSESGSCPSCQKGPSAGEIWLRVQNSLIADNSSITNTSIGRAQAGITKIIKDNYFSYGAIWEPDFADIPTNTVRLTNSEVTVESQHTGLPGYLRIRADNIILDHSVLNSEVNDVTNLKATNGQLIDVVGAGERSRALTDGRDVQGSVLVSAKNLDITGGGIIAPTQGTRIGSRIEVHADHLTTRPGTKPGGTLGEPQILDPTDPTRVVISGSSTGSGGAGLISITGESVPIPEGTPFAPASSILLTGTDVLTDTRSDALGGKIELKAIGPIVLQSTTISSNVNNVRAQSANVTDQGGNIVLSAGSLVMQGSGISAISRGTQDGGNIVIAAQESITAGAGSTISARNMGAANAGNITVNAGNQLTMTNSSVTTEAAQASGGNITVAAADMVHLTNSQINASVQGAQTTIGGAIVIDPNFVILQNSQILAQASQGQGGNISLTTNALVSDATSLVDASSQFGVSGTVRVQSPNAPAAGKIVPLSKTTLETAPLLSQRCAAMASGLYSSFVVAGHYGLPTEPAGWLASPLATLSVDAGQGVRREGREGANVASSLTNETEILSLRGLPSSNTVANILANWTAGCGS